VPIHDCGATNTIFRQSDTHYLKGISPATGVTVGLPNGTSIKSAATGTLSNNKFIIPVPIFSNNALNRSLISTADYCNNGCTAVFTATSATITHDASGEIISQSYKEPHDRLWPFGLPTIQTHNVVRHEINADFVAYSSASFFSPPDTSLANALKLGWLGNFPRLTARMLTANKPNSLSTAKGHLQQTRQRNYRSTHPAPSQRVVDHNSTPQPDPESDVSDNNLVFTKISRRADFLNSSDMPGRFTHVSHRGYEYVLISVYRGYIHAEPLKSRQGAELISAYRATYSFFKYLGHTPHFQMLDNEDSAKLQTFFRDEAKVEAQYVPPSTHRRNRAERAIRDWKAHFIAGLDSVDKDFLMYLWCELLEQAELTLNHLRHYHLNPLISAHEGIHGTKFDFLAHPIHPPGTKILVLDPVTTRESWAPHGLSGFYLGPALLHYRSFRVFISSTKGFRISDSLSWHPEKIRLPGSSKEEIIFSTAEKILNELSARPHTENSTLSQLATDMHSLMQEFSNPVPPQEQRVIDQHVHPIETLVLPAEQRVVAQPVPLPDTHPTDSSTRPRRNKSSDSPASDQYKIISSRDAHAKDKHFFPYIGQSFTDTDDNLHFKITTIVAPCNSFAKNPCLYYRYFDMDKFSTAPPNESQYEHTPCKEFIKQRRLTGIIFSPEFLVWDNHLSASHTSPIHAWDPAAAPIFVQGGPIHTIINANHVTFEANSTFHSTTDSPLLNLTPAGQQISYRHVMRGPDRELWRNASGKELIKLIVDRKTLVPIHRHEQPPDQRRFTTYYNPQVKEKLDANGDIIQRVRGTFGGNKLCAYNGPTSSPVADISLIKIHWNSVISDRRNFGTNTRYATLDIKDFYLMSTLPQPEWILVPVKDIPSTTLEEHHLNDFVVDGHILCRVDGTMYGHPYAGRGANLDLVTHLASYHFFQDPNIPCLFTHDTRPISFTLVVDDFGVKYNDLADVHHLIQILEAKYDVHSDLTGSKYIGVKLDWDYENNTLTPSMPNYVAAGIARFCPDGPLSSAKTPGIYLPPQYGAPDLGATVDTTPLVGPLDKQFIMEVVGYFLYYARIIDHLMLPCLTFLAKKQSAPTQATLAATHHFLRYAACHQTFTAIIHASDMRLVVISDGSHLSQERAGSIAGGYHFLSNHDSSHLDINAPILALCTSIPTVCGAASETEYAALYLNAQHAYFERTILSALGYPQPPSPLYADNSAAVGIANDTVKLKRSKAIDMRYHWIRDRVRQGIFKVFWSTGLDNIADYFTKLQPAQRQKVFTAIFTHTR